MIPLRDSIPPSTTPLVTYAIVALCGLAFFVQLTSRDSGEELVERYGMVPVRITRPDEAAIITFQEAIDTPAGIVIREQQRELAPAVLPPWMTLFTSMFLHGGLMHFLGNMWFLFVFGDNVEDRFGHIAYTLLYLGTGLIAALSHLIANSLSSVPTIGASGAIAGVMGAYLVLYPHARVQAFLPPIFTFVLPAPVFLVIWFAMQAFSGISSVGSTASTGVAWWAHIGGFVAGVILAIGIRSSSFGRPEVTLRRSFDHYSP